MVDDIADLFEAAKAAELFEIAKRADVATKEE